MSRKPPPDPIVVIFFVDRCLGENDVPQALVAAGARIEKHSAHFKDDDPDEDWLPVVGAEGWIVLSKDERIRKRRNERDALMNAKVGAYLLTNANMTGKDMASAFVSALPRMTSQARSIENPSSPASRRMARSLSSPRNVVRVP